MNLSPSRFVKAGRFKEESIREHLAIKQIDGEWYTNSEGKRYQIGYLYLKDDLRPRVMAEVTGVNYEIRGMVERQAILQTLTETLNSLPYDVHWIIDSSVIDLHSLIQSREGWKSDWPENGEEDRSIREELYNNSVRKLTELSSGTVIKDVRFYIVLVADSNYFRKGADGSMRKQLQGRLGILDDSLSGAGIGIAPLSVMQWHENIYRFFDQRMAKLQRMRSLQHESNRVVIRASKDTQIKLQVNEERVRELIVPSVIELEEDRIKFRGSSRTDLRTLQVVDYATFVDPNWLSSILHKPINLRLNLHFKQEPADKVKSTLNKAAKGLKIASFSTTAVSAERQISEEEADLSDLDKQLRGGLQRPFKLSLYATASISSLPGTTDEEALEALEEATEELESGFSQHSVFTQRVIFQKWNDLHSILPLGWDALERKLGVLTSGLTATIVPHAFSRLDPEGITLGLAEGGGRTHSLVTVDFNSLENRNCAHFGTPGAGKSTAIKMRLYEEVAAGVLAIGIDHKDREYEALTEACRGSYISLGPTSDTHLNVMAIARSTSGGIDPAARSINPVSFKKGSLRNFFSMSVGLQGNETPILDAALNKLYQDFGILEQDQMTWIRKSPRIEDLQAMLKSGFGNDETAEGLAQKLEYFTTGQNANIFNRDTNLRMNSRMLTFDVSELTMQNVIEQEILGRASLLAQVYWVLFSYFLDLMLEVRGAKYIFIDEAKELLRYKHGVSYTGYVARIARTYQTGVILGTQYVGVFLQDEEARGILSTISTVYLHEQSPQDLELLRETFQLTDGDAAWLASASRGKCLVKLAGNRESIFLKTAILPWEANIYNTEKWRDEKTRRRADHAQKINEAKGVQMR